MDGATSSIECYSWIQVMFRIIIASVFIPFSLALTRSDVRASSLIDTHENYALLGHVIASHVTKGITSCSLLCLNNADCLSFNFGQNQEIYGEGLCQLNNQRCHDNREVNLTPVGGYVYGEFIDVKIKQYTFTTLGKQGIDGPTQSELGGYDGTNLEGKGCDRQWNPVLECPFLRDLHYRGPRGLRI
ncbi:Glycine rich protein [Desmophyllum pertusum]|uniref:Glycine rich protein n=1 Tax=Desmophyllum pertusum TaxID=174260 RepID=A0A9W9ZUW6_9CNID|nr:Glycine rich protein [Desmophyllum pertusum]